MKKIKILLCMMLLLMPTTVLAAGYVMDSILPFAILWEAFASIHMSVFFLSPLANLISDEGNEKKTFWKLFIARACILLIFDFFITPYIFIFDFFLIFAGVIIINPILSLILKKKPFEGSISLINTSLTIPSTETKCAKCGTILDSDDNYCRSCGAFVSGNQAQAAVIP
ncbi:MAG: zinc ribbon domain-containing protein, partial [Bacilli bacterium]|nr:zinc ribbon domain-containing protein [Bacilli bacterium]